MPKMVSATRYSVMISVSIDSSSVLVHRETRASRVRADARPTVAEALQREARDPRSTVIPSEAGRTPSIVTQM